MKCKGSLKFSHKVFCLQFPHVSTQSWKISLGVSKTRWFRAQCSLQPDGGTRTRQISDVEARLRERSGKMELWRQKAMQRIDTNSGDELMKQTNNIQR